MANDLQKEIGLILQTIPHTVETAVDEASDKVAKEAVKKLKATSPVGHGKKAGAYKKGWSVKKDKTGKRTVYNKQYQLTHLLENGHVKVLFGKATGGFVKGQPHIKPVEEWAQNEFPEECEKLISKGLGK